MTSILHAITWEFWRENRWWIIVSVSAILGLGSLVYSSSLSQYNADEPILHFTVFVIEMWTFCAFLCVSYSNKGRGRLGFHEHLFIKPVRMRSVTLCRLGLAVITAVSLYLLTAGIFYWAAHVAWPIAFPCLCLTAGIVFLHAIAWSLPAIPVLQIILSATGLYCLSLLYFYDSGAESTMWLLTFITLGSGLALVGASLDRRSQRLQLTGLWSQIVKAATAWLPWKSCTNVTPQRALFWLHWIKKGWIMPAISVALMILGYVLTWAIPWRKPEAFVTIYYTCLFLFHAVGLPLLVSLITCQQETQNQGLPTYASSLPVTNHEMLIAYLKASLASLALSWGVFATGLCLLQLLLMMAGIGNHTEELYSNIRNMTFFYSPAFGEDAISLREVFHMQIGYVLMTWAALGLTGSMLLSGRRSVGVTTLLILFTWPIIPAIAELLNAPKPVLIAIWTMESALFIVAIIGGTLAAYVYGTLKRQISLHLTFSALLAYAAINLFYGEFIWRSPEAPLASLALLAVMTLPLAPFATAPLALAWNRHR